MGNRTTINGKGLGLNGDKTSTGATCISSFVGFTESGKLPLHVGDKTSPCPKCGKVGEIVTGDSALVFFDLISAVDGSIIACNCPLGSNVLIVPAGGFLEPVAVNDFWNGYDIGLVNSNGNKNTPEQYAQTAHKHTEQEDESPATCACNRDITSDEFSKITTGLSADEMQTYLDSINLWLPWFGINTCREKTHFLAQVCGETSAFRYMSEIGGERATYAPWYGRGLLQLTGKINYLAYDEFSDDIIMSHENKLLSLPHALISALWYFCNKTSCLSHSGEDDFNTVTCIINGGCNGYNNRLGYFNKIVTVLKAEHLNKLCVDDEFLFENSSIYNNKTYTLSWALWHDADTKFKGTNKESNEAKKGYERAKVLWGDDLSRKNETTKLYGIHRNHIGAFIRHKLGESS
ncbi:PAAR domain-containing protein [Obesumbacterium proteus]|uniref:PAAR domain-containing protein n=1 Tax=Obesumbacterium proteus TaxID=82983 RepID=UPI00242EB175|nr:PAAR domain-containing protein [Obesumbacterium proteus]